MINFAPWFYKDLLAKNDLIDFIDFYNINLINGCNEFEANSFLNKNLKPSWVGQSSLYKNSDGTGTSKHKNIAVYKSISEALERLAFYELAETPKEKDYCFDLNPTTTGMAAFPHWSTKPARLNAQNEAVERWAIHQFNMKKLPIVTHPSKLENLIHYEIITPFLNVRVTLLAYIYEKFHAYSFAAGGSLEASFNRAIVELNRNIFILKRFYDSDKSALLNSATDKKILFYSTLDGRDKFNELINQAPRTIIAPTPKVLCDKELVGQWTKYTKVWRYLLENSYFDCTSDHKFFMF